MNKKVLLTGGAGFIGHIAIKEILHSTDWEVLTFDRLSYAGDLRRIDYIAKEIGDSSEKRLRFVYHDLKAPLHNDLIKEIEDVNYIIHIGASSHVTRSVETPQIFMEDNIMGSFNLLEASRHLNNLELFYYFSTDEVFGPSLNNEKFKEWDRYNSKNPYSATKAAAEEITIAYANTYSLPILITHCSNVYGERQHYEKFIPNTIKKILSKEEIIVHTDSENLPGSRYYLYNEDLAKSIIFLVKNYKEVAKKSFETSNMQPPKVNISGQSLVSNLEIVELIGKYLDKEFKYKLVENDPTRPGHDIKYGLDISLLNSLGGVFDREFEDGLKRTVEWYIKNPNWTS
tara:strand:+ start:515 stop:1543 length:1029 start_codon:yes stop_codon:yes gene_type:complete